VLSLERLPLPEAVEKATRGEIHDGIWGEVSAKDCEREIAWSREVSAVLFETTRAMVTLDLPGVRHVGPARPGNYGYLLRAGFVVHEVRGADGAVTGYVMAPGRAHVMVWEREPRGGVVVTVTGLSNVPESGGGGGGGGGGAM